MGTYVLINDIHLSDRAPSSCTDAYLDDLFDLLDAVRDAGHAASGIILAGDVFHHKTPSRTSHATVMRLIRWANTCHCPVYTVLGNHDLQNDRVNSICESQPLGVCIASGAIQLLDGWIDDGMGDYIYGVPWQMTFDHASVSDALNQWRAHADPDSPALVVTHAPLYPPGQELTYEFFPVAHWAQIMGGHGTVHYGHVHEPHGIYTVGRVTFSNCGALSRGSLHEHNLTRTPQYAVWDSHTGTITHHRIEAAKPADEVFRLQEVGEVKTAKLELDNVLASISQTRLEITSTEAVMAHVRSLGLDEPVAEAIVELLENAP